MSGNKFFNSDYLLICSAQIRHSYIWKKQDMKLRSDGKQIYFREELLEVKLKLNVDILIKGFI